MTAIKGIVKAGRIELNAPPDRPDGNEVVVQPIPVNQSLGISEHDWPDCPQAIAEWLKWYDSLEPLIFTDDERAVWEAARQDQKEFKKANHAERADILNGIWQ